MFDGYGPLAMLKLSRQSDNVEDYRVTSFRGRVYRREIIRWCNRAMSLPDWHNYRSCYISRTMPSGPKSLGRDACDRSLFTGVIERTDLPRRRSTANVLYGRCRYCECEGGYMLDHPDLR